MYGYKRYGKHRRGLDLGWCRAVEDEAVEDEAGLQMVRLRWNFLRRDLGKCCCSACIIQWGSEQQQCGYHIRGQSTQKLLE